VEEITAGRGADNIFASATSSDEEAAAQTESTSQPVKVRCTETCTVGTQLLQQARCIYRFIKRWCPRLWR